MSSLSRSEFQRQIQRLDPISFEQFIADIWAHRGWNVRVTSASHDRGIDIIAEWNGVISRTEAIHVTRYQSEVSSHEVQRYGRIPNQDPAIETMITVTRSSFSQPAQELAADLNVKTVDCHDLHTLVRESELVPLLFEYVESNETETQSRLSRVDMERSKLHTATGVDASASSSTSRSIVSSSSRSRSTTAHSSMADDRNTTLTHPESTGSFKIGLYALIVISILLSVGFLLTLL